MIAGILAFLSIACIVGVPVGWYCSKHGLPDIFAVVLSIVVIVCLVMTVVASPWFLLLMWGIFVFCRKQFGYKTA